MEDNKQKLTDTLFRETYRDFYDADDGFHRVMFNSGKALQARELIESQTIIQEEIARFGGNIFKEGALVKPGGVTVDNKVQFVRFSESSVVPTNITQLTNQKGIKADVLSVNDKTVYVRYTDTSTVSDNGSTPPTFLAGENLEAGEVVEVGSATLAHFAAGDYFIQGHFVHAVGGSFFIDAHSPTPTDDIGFRIDEYVITEMDEGYDYLNDNQGDVPNRTSPGAHRYQIVLTPTRRDLITEDQNFVFIARVVDGVVTREVTSHDGYNRINKLLAQRTKEESGDYVAKDFTAVFEDLDDQNLLLDVSEGIAYVDGYRLDIGRTEITVPRAQTFQEKTVDNIPASYGNWVYLNLAGTDGLGDIANFGKLNLYKNGVSTPIGSANLRGIEEDQVGYRAYLFNIFMVENEAFRNVTTMEQVDGSTTFTLAGPEIYGTTDNNLLFPLSQTSPVRTSVGTITYTKQVVNSGLVPSGGELAPTGVEPQNWVISEDGVGIQEITAVSGKYTGLTGSSYTVLTYQEDTVARKTKTLKTKTLDITSGYTSVLDINAVDGYDLISVIQTFDGESTDITFMYEMDGGQRDNFYDYVRFKLIGGNTIPENASLRFSFRHFEHSDNGQFFSVTSYQEGEDQLSYNDIPSYTLANGTTVSLRDVVDFRPSKNPDGTFKVMNLPQNASALSVDNVKYYLPRIDALVANSVDSYGDVGFGELQVIQGQPSQTPRPPEVPTGALPLYYFQLNPYTFSSSDLTSQKQSHKRYTMKDIAKIEDRVEGLYELTTLSLLESNTNSLTVLDADGDPRTKSGFIADNFSSFNFSDVNNGDFRASIETVGGELQPSFRENLVRLKKDDAQGDTTRKGDFALLNYTHKGFISQTLATSTMNINPYAVITQQGHITLSPSSDEWVETRTLPPIMQTTVRRTPPRNLGVGFNDMWNWNGIANFQRNQFDVMGENIFPQTTMSRTIQEFVGERVAGVEVIPFMRSRLVSFKAEGLRPNTNVWPYFGNQNVSAWCRPSNTFIEFSTTESEVGSSESTATGILGSNQLTTNDKGEVFGQFLIPNTDAIKFRTGTQDFVLLDINVDTTAGRLTSAQESEALTSSSAPYVSTGTIESIQRTIRTTRVPQRVRGRRDPLAQSFFVDQTENPNGIYITKARVYVQSKDSVIPMQVQIRPVENGIPTTTIVPGSVKFVKPEDITLAPNSDIASIRAAATEIEFDEPVYLTAGEEYAIVLLAESVEYNVYVAQTYETIIGGNEGRVSKQPTLGSLFMSQSGSTWTPDQTKDLMFELDRASFSKTGTLHLVNAILPTVSLGDNPFTTTKDSREVSVRHEGHGFSALDQVTFSGSGPVGGLDLNGTFTVDNITSSGYTITVPAASGVANASVSGGNAEVNGVLMPSTVATQNVMFDEFTPQVSAITPNNSSISAQVSKAQGASYGGDRGTDSVSYSQGALQDVFLNEVNRDSSPSVIATADNKKDTSGNPVPSIEFVLTLTSDAGYDNDGKVSPLVDLQRVSVLALENVIGSGDEAQHITRPTTIDESSVGLKILFGANRPTGSDFEVYAKTSVTDDGLVDADWVQISIDGSVPSDDNPSVFREYEYTIDETSDNAPDPFTAFQVKVVMKTNNTSKSPSIRDLRVIALAT